MEDIRVVKCSHPGCLTVLEVDVAAFPNEGYGWYLTTMQEGKLRWFRDYEDDSVDRLTFCCREHVKR